MIYQILREAWISISAYKMRTFLTMLGIVIGVASVVLMVAAGQTVQNEITKTFDSMGTNLIILAPAETVSGGVRGGRGRPSITFKDVEALKALRCRNCFVCGEHSCSGGVWFKQLWCKCLWYESRLFNSWQLGNRIWHPFYGKRCASRKTLYFNWTNDSR